MHTLRAQHTMLVGDDARDIEWVREKFSKFGVTVIGNTRKRPNHAKKGQEKYALVG